MEGHKFSSFIKMTQSLPGVTIPLNCILPPDMQVEFNDVSVCPCNVDFSAIQSTYSVVT